MEHREPGTDLLGEREEVELDAELAMVAAFGLLEAVQVLGERGLRLPRGAVDALQHRALLVAAPVRAGHLLQLEHAELAGRRHVRAATQVDELDLGLPVGTVDHVAVHRHARAVAAGLARVVVVGRAAAHLLDDLALVGLIGEQRERVVVGELGAFEALVGLDDRAASRPRCGRGRRR